VSRYEPGDFIKVEFSAGSAGLGEWMWVRVHRCDDTEQVVFGTLDNVPVSDTADKLQLGAELAISFTQIREHKKAWDFKRQDRSSPLGG
jgi:hypothetical protein